MAVVREWTTPEGTNIKINDDAYRNQTPEEKQRAIDNVNKTVSRLLYGIAERRYQEYLDSQEKESNAG